MTTFGSVLERDLSVSTFGGARPTKPSVNPELTRQLSNLQGLKRGVGDRDPDEDEAGRFASAIEQRLAKAQARAEAASNSMTARARLADLASMANKPDVAVAAALQTLQLGAERAAAGRDVDAPSAYVATQVLLQHNEEVRAEDYLASLSFIPLLAQVRALFLASRSQLEEALYTLSGFDSAETPGIAGMRGYLYLLQGEFAKALHELREANRQDPSDVDCALNLAFALYNIGSPRKAANWARYATRLSPGRHGATLSLLYYLIESRELSAAEAEVRAVLDKGIVETPELLLMRARLASEQGLQSRVLPLLRRARAAAGGGSGIIAAEIDANVAAFEYFGGKNSRAEALRKVRSALQRAPHSAALVSVLASLITRCSEIAEVKQAFSNVRVNYNPSFGHALCTQIAFFECRFDDAYELARVWARAEPKNQDAVSKWLMWRGALDDDWKGAAKDALNAVGYIGHSKAMTNAAAYLLALAGRGGDALAIIAKSNMSLAVVNTSNFVLAATAGLAHISKGNLEKGLRLYRQAADKADEVDDNLRSLMTLHQAMGIRRLGILEGHRQEVLAGALPAVDLPEHWTDLPGFQFLAEVARRCGWEWPVVLD